MPLDIVALIHRYSLLQVISQVAPLPWLVRSTLDKTLFKDRDEKIQACADRGAEIAA